LVKIDNQATADLRKLGELLDGIEVAMLTTRAADGSMVSRPLQTLALDARGELVFFTAADSGKIDQLDANPDVNIAYAHPGEHRYVSVRGHAYLSRDRASIDEFWSMPQKIFFPRGKDDPNLLVLRVRVRDAAYWESAGNFIARALDFATGLLDDEPSDLGKQGRLTGHSD
jgi:general stress protein 26